MHELVKLENNEVTVDGTFQAIKLIEEKIDKMKKEEQEINHNRKTLEAAVESAKNTIKSYMRDHGLAEISGSYVKYSLNRGNPSLKITDESIIPQIYKEETITTKIRKDAIKDQLKLGDEIPGCALEDTWVLKVGTST